MDVRYFLQERIAFIRQLFAVSTELYFDRIRKIEAEQEPWIPEYSEDGEPPFLVEWLEADESIQVLGRACLSMLTATLHVYLKTWQKIIGSPSTEPFRNEFKDNWINAYLLYFSAHVGVPVESCPVNLSMLQELVLARNQIQHPSSITTSSASYSESDLAKLSHPFFVDERENLTLAEIVDSEKRWLISPTIRVTPDKLNTALSEVEQFARWLETVERNENG